MLPHLALAALLASTASASPLRPLAKRDAASYAGTATSDVFPPASPTAHPELFPPESVVGYLQSIGTGIEPNVLQTAVAAPSHAAVYPLVVPAPAQTAQAVFQAGKAAEVKPASKEFLSARHWGSLSPSYSVDSAVYGLEGASAKVPDECSVVQAHIYFRHGARYPSFGATTSAFATLINEAANNATTGGFNAKGALAFLNTWKYSLGEELLTPFGRQQLFDEGVAARLAYGHLLNNFTAANELPLIRTESQDRMVKSAQNFAAGFFGIPSEDQYNLLIEIEADGFNTTGAGYDTCKNDDLDPGYLGSDAQTAYYAKRFPPTVARLNSMIDGYEFTVGNVNSMFQLCAYETLALGYSKFCELFSEEEFKIFGYGYDLDFYGNSFMGSPVAAAQGKGFLEEFVARLTNTPLTTFDSNTNRTLDSNPVTFPLHQSLYLDAAHEVAILNFLAALNMTALSPSPPSTDSPETDGHVFNAAAVVPMATNWVAQVLECAPSKPTRQIRFLVNDAVVPMMYPGCDAKDFNGLCALETVVKVLKERIDEIDFDYDCNANYTLPTGLVDLNGRAPRY